MLPQEASVNLGFFRGTDLPDPAGVMEGTGAKMCHVKIRSLAEAERPLIETLIRGRLPNVNKRWGIEDNNLPSLDIPRLTSPFAK